MLPGTILRRGGIEARRRLPDAGRAPNEEAVQRHHQIDVRGLRAGLGALRATQRAGRGTERRVSRGVAVDVSGEQYIDLEREAQTMLMRE
jgi:hypothetical protein